MSNIDSRPERPGRLAGKVVLVTGAASGIGKAVAEISAAEGGRVALIDYDVTTLTANYLGVNTLSIRADISNTEDVDAAVSGVVQQFGRLDVLMNVAGVHDMMEPAEELEIATWERVFDINVLGTALMIRRALVEMLPRRAGSIVNCASTSAFLGANGGVAYSASKGAIVALTRQVAHDVAGRGIRVNAVAPGPTTSNILNTATKILGVRRPGPMTRHFFSKAVGRGMNTVVPMGRFADPDEVARAFVFLASDDASYITGTTLMVDGGQSIN